MVDAVASSGLTRYDHGLPRRGVRRSSETAEVVDIVTATPRDPAAESSFGQLGGGVEPAADAADGARVRRASDLIYLAGAVLYPAWHWVFLAVAPTSRDLLVERLAVGLLILVAGAAARTELARRRSAALDAFLMFLVTGHYLSLLWRNQFSVPYLVGLMVVIASVGVIITEVSVALSFAGLSLGSIVVLGLLSPVPFPQQLEYLLATTTILGAVVMGAFRTAAARRVAVAHVAKGRAALANLVQAIPDPVFVRASDMSLLFANEAGRRLETATGYDLAPVVRQELAAIAAAHTLEQDVEVRTSSGIRAMSVKTAVAGGAPDGPAMLVTVVRDVTERREMADALRRRVNELEETRERLRKLQLMLPICMHCSNIRVSDGQWETLELYVSKISHTTFTHTLCKGCLERHYPAMEGLENQE
jgi:PAS domain-containing protein